VVAAFKRSQVLGKDTPGELLNSIRIPHHKYNLYLVIRPKLLAFR
jgi:hypothetical protein